MCSAFGAVVSAMKREAPWGLQEVRRPESPKTPQIPPAHVRKHVPARHTAYLKWHGPLTPLTRALGRRHEGARGVAACLLARIAARQRAPSRFALRRGSSTT
jgi:hypothetical protein